MTRVCCWGVGRSRCGSDQFAEREHRGRCLATDALINYGLGSIRKPVALLIRRDKYTKNRDKTKFLWFRRFILDLTSLDIQQVKSTIVYPDNMLLYIRIETIPYNNKAISIQISISLDARNIWNTLQLSGKRSSVLYMDGGVLCALNKKDDREVW